MKKRTHRAFASLLVMVIVFAATLPTFTWAQSHTSSEPIATFVIEPNSGHVIVPLNVNDKGPYQFVLDTGAAGVFLDTTVAQDLKLKTSLVGQTQGAGEGSVDTYTTPKVTLSIPATNNRPEEIRFQEQDALVIPISSTFGEQDQVTFDGIVGGPVFHRYVVEVDWREGKVNLYRPQGYQPPQNATIVPMKLEFGFPVFEGSVVPVKNRIAQPEIRGKFMLDLGANHGVVIRWPVVDQHQLIDRDDPNQKELSGGEGIGGKLSPFRSTPAKSIQLGELTVRETQLELATGPGGAPPISNLIGFIGTTFVHKYKTVIDYPNKRLVLVARQGE